MSQPKLPELPSITEAYYHIEEANNRVRVVIRNKYAYAGPKMDNYNLRLEIRASTGPETITWRTVPGSIQGLFGRSEIERKAAELIEGGWRRALLGAVRRCDDLSYLAYLPLGSHLRCAAIDAVDESLSLCERRYLLTEKFELKGQDLELPSADATSTIERKLIAIVHDLDGPSPAAIYRELSDRKWLPYKGTIAVSLLEIARELDTLEKLGWLQSTPTI